MKEAFLYGKKNLKVIRIQDANLFANFIAIVIFKRVLDIKEMDQKEYEFKTKLFMNFFASNPVKKKLIQKEIRRH